MKILSLAIDWYVHAGNDPHIYFEVDHYPDSDEFIFSAVPVGNSAYYYAVHPDGWLRCHFHDPSDQAGYGGAAFNLRMDDGSVKTIRGPWDQGASRANKLLKRSFLDVAARPEGNSIFYASYFAVDVLEKHMLSLNPWLKFQRKGVQTGPGSDVQNMIIQHGTKINPDSFRDYLPKEIRHHVGYHFFDAQYDHQKRYISYWGEKIIFEKLTSLWIPPSSEKS